MHCSRDSSLLECFLNLIALIDKDSVLGKDTGTVRTLNHGRHFAGQQFVVARADLQALLDLPIEALELGQDDRALQGIHTPANADAPAADEETAQRAPRRPDADKAYQGLL